MKKVVFGAFMFLAGFLSIALLLAGSMGNDWTTNGHCSFSWNLSQYGLMPALYMFAVLAIIGLVVAVIGLLDNKP
ncbi:hypothetical protein OBV_13600 [Oscillibacter valericigenes Sjm18-20]|nr:hypothetical protein OBV_13600 [Oscillibacter valericigenes Sjm18-20]